MRKLFTYLKKSFVVKHYSIALNRWKRWKEGSERSQRREEWQRWRKEERGWGWKEERRDQSEVYV